MLDDAAAGPLIIVATAISAKASTTTPVVSAIADQRHAKKTLPPANNEIANVANSRSGGPKSVNTDDNSPTIYTTTNPKRMPISNRNVNFLASGYFFGSLDMMNILSETCASPRPRLSK